MRRSWIAGALGLIAAFGCGGLVPDLTQYEPVPPPSAEWVGTWSWSDEAREATLVVAPDGSIAWVNQGPNGSNECAGPAEGWESTIRACFGFQTFEVDAPPAQDADGTWTMQLDGRTFVRTARDLEPVDEEIRELVAPDDTGSASL